MTGDERGRLAGLRSNLKRRDLIYQLTRRFFHEQGFIEVETPVRVPGVAPELFITPFQSEGWFLTTSPELYMKRLLAAGYEKLFQISHCFRRGERGSRHNPEFAMLEWYRAGADYLQMVRDTEQLIISVVNGLGMSTTIRYQGKPIDLSLPWQRLAVRDAFITSAGWDPVIMPDSLRFDTDLVEKVMPAFAEGHPTVFMDYPAAMASLARLKSGGQVAERAEVFIGGLEIANAYSELTDPIEQETRFREEIARAAEQFGRKLDMPQKFLEAVAHLPACGGIALGMDRLVMLLCDAKSIDEVMAFTSDTA